MDVHPYLDVAGPIAFAHRGGTQAHPENTLAAFSHAVALGYTHLETDVHATADGVAVAFHDASLDRVTDKTGVVSELPWSAVRTARVGGTEPICRLDELLAEFPDVRFNLDPKSDAAVEPLVDVLVRTGSVDRVCVTSFSYRRATAVARLIGPELCIGSGPGGIARLWLRSMRLAVRPPVDRVAQVPVRYGPIPIVTRSFVRAANAAGIAVHVWTVNRADEMERLLDLGVDGIMTDHPEVLRRVLADRGLWPTGS